jgi:hypothetical protein
LLFFGAPFEIVGPVLHAPEKVHEDKLPGKEGAAALAGVARRFPELMPVELSAALQEATAAG